MGSREVPFECVDASPERLDSVKKFIGEYVAAMAHKNRGEESAS